MTLVAHLAGLDADALRALLECRPDVLVEPAPRSLEELAQRLGGVDSLSRALQRCNRDELTVAQVIALRAAADVAEIARLVAAPEEAVNRVVDDLCARGLAWRADGRMGLPDRLAEHFAAGIGGFRPLRLIANQARVDQLREALSGLGGDPTGLRKADLVERLGEMMNDRTVVSAAVARLPVAARRHLDLLLGSDGSHFFFGPGPHGPTRSLVGAGLLIEGPYHSGELPREVAVLLRADGTEPVVGRPVVRPATSAHDTGQAGAEAALRAITTLLDEARRHPLARLKKGGVGTRERARLARLGVDEPALSIDLAHAAGLLTAAPAGYTATREYESWRDEAPAARWARLSHAWFGLDVAPTSRETEDGEVAPPVPLISTSGVLRRALLRAAGGGRSIASAAEHLDWFCPLHGYDAVGRARKVEAALVEAGALGIVSGDRLTDLGELLVEVEERPDEFARRCAGLLPATTAGTLLLQSDLTAVVSGQPTASVARLLAASATSESQGTASTWRFSPASVRAALDAGHDANELAAELAAASNRPLPQPLAYLISDVARRHGSVRLRGSRCCLTGSEAEVAEVLATRSLRGLHLRRLAPTVLTSPSELDDVLAALRRAGFSPMPEDAEGVVILPGPEQAAAPVAAAPAPRPRLSAEELAHRLLTEHPAPLSAVHTELGALAPQLDDAEVSLLADALEHGRDVRIAYRNKAGNRSVRDIAPQQLYGRWLRSWCHLRSAEREFTIANIETVAPVG